MYCITVTLGMSSWALMFKEKPEKQLEELRSFMRQQHLTQQIGDSRVMTLTDDFSQECDIVAGALAGFLFEDMDVSQEATIQRSLHHHITQAKLQKRAQSDPTLRAASLGSGVPSFMPGVNGRLS